MSSPNLIGPLTGFHDGKLESVAVADGTAVFGLVHVDGRRFKLNLSGVEALSINDFREGNIILELQVVAGSDFQRAGLTPGDVRATLEVLFLRPHSNAASEYHEAYDNLLQSKLDLLEKGAAKLVILDPACGADLVAFCTSAELLDAPYA